MKKIFEYHDMNDKGYSGLLELNAPNEFNPGQGLTVAHDCIEHFKGDDGSCDKEFMAFGAMLWIRGDNGRLTNYASGWDYSKGMATDLSLDVWNHYCENHDLKPFTPKSRYSYKIEKIANATKDFIYSDHSMENIDKDKLNYFIEGLKYWISVGYSKAKKKYPNSSYALCTFELIQEKVDKIIKYCQPYDLVEIKYRISSIFVEIKHTRSFERKDMY